MALTSTQFMAAPGGFSTTLSSKLDRIDCSDVLSAVLKADTAILGHIKMGPVAENIEVNWIEDELNPAYVKCSGSSNVTITVSSGYGTASLQRFLRNNAILQPEGSEIAVQIGASITGRTLTVAAYGSTTWASWTMTKCYIIGMPYADISAASSDMSLSRTKRKNFMQVFERAVEITDTRQNMGMLAVTDELKTQIERRTKEIKRELNIAVLRGFPRVTASNTPSADHELRTMSGIIQTVRDPNLDTTNEDTTVINASSVTLLAGHINSLAYKIMDEGGLDETADPIIVVGMAQARTLSAMEANLRRLEQGERTVGYYKNIFLTDLGVEMPIVVDRWMPKDKLIILDRSRVSLRPMKGDAWHAVKMSVTGRSSKWQISGQYTLQIEHAGKCHGMIYNLA